MRIVILLAATLFLTSCHSKKEIPMEKEMNSSYRLHDLWSLQTINKEKVSLVGEGSRPLMELYIEDKKIRGNAGCNQLNGNITMVTDKEITFERLATTKMMCPDMKIEQAYLGQLRLCRTYTLKELKLTFYNETGDELMTFKKVD